jgi:hypothetical protein
LLLAVDLGLVTRDEYGQLDATTAEVKRMLTGFVRKLMADG